MLKLVLPFSSKFVVSTTSSFPRISSPCSRQFLVVLANRKQQTGIVDIMLNRSSTPQVLYNIFSHPLLATCCNKKKV